MGTQQALEGQLIGGRFRVQEFIGEGGMGEVYRGIHEPLGQEVAIKVLKREHAQDKRMEARFRREARSASRVQHRNVVGIFDTGQLDDGRLYLVMEYIRGRSLVDVLDEEGALPAARALRLGIQIADAMAAAHGMGIMHRDLKPENIVVMDTPEGELVKVLDFGLARMVEIQSAEEKITMSGEVFGTPVYMSPEQCFGEDLSYTTDVYSFGVCLFEMLTGEVPFSGNNIVAIMLAQKNQIPEAPSRVYPDAAIPPELDALVLRCLSKKPADRFANGMQLVEELRHVYDIYIKRSLGAPADLQVQRRPSAEYSAAGVSASLTPESVRAMVRERLRNQLQVVLEGLRRHRLMPPGLGLNMAHVLKLEDEISNYNQQENACINRLLEMESGVRSRVGQLRLAVQDLSYDRELLARQLRVNPQLRCSELTTLFPYLDMASAPPSGRELLEDITFQLMELEKRITEILQSLETERAALRNELEALRTERSRMEADMEALLEALISELVEPETITQYRVDPLLMAEIHTLKRYFHETFPSAGTGTD